MKIDPVRLESASAVAAVWLENQKLPTYMKNRWRRALEKAAERLVEKPYFSWQPNRMTIVSVPTSKTTELGCRFYQASQAECRRVDKDGLCQAFFEGFPCWHRGAFLLLGIYFGERQETQRGKNKNVAAVVKSVN